MQADVTSDETFGGLLALRQGFDRGGISFSLAHRDTGGFDVSGENGQDDGDVNTTLNLVGDYGVAPGSVLGGWLRYVSRESDFDDFNFGAATEDDLITDAPGNSTEVDDLFASLFADFDGFGGRFTNRLVATFAETDCVTFNDNDKSGDNTGQRWLFSYIGTVALDASTVDAADQTLSFALQYEEEEFQENDADVVFNPGQLDTQDRTQVGYVLEYRGSFASGLNLQGSVRFDDNDEFEDFTTDALGVSPRRCPCGSLQSS